MVMPRNYVWMLPQLFLFIISVVKATDLEFLSEPTSRLVKSSDGKVVFHCEVSPTTADVRWLWKGQPIQPSRWLRASKHKLTVHLSKLDKHFPLKNGSFQCEAVLRNRVLVSASAELIIAVLQPFDVQSDIYITANKGGTVLIPCHPPHSVPTVVTEFLFNNETTIEKSNNKHLLMPSGSLQIVNADFSDSGEYICSANNPYLNEKCQAQHKVFLQVTNSMTIVPPQFLVAPPPETIAVLGSNITLECAVSGYPLPSIMWHKVNGHLPRNRHQNLAGNLLLFGVHRADEGTYVCEAVNSLGGRILRNTTLEIHETPQITKGPRDTYTEVGKDVTLHCMTRGRPHPVVTWFHNGKVVEIIEEHKFRDSELVLRDVNHKHSGIYQCFAKNQLGSVYSSCVVHVLHGNKSYNVHKDVDDYDDYDSDIGNHQKFHHKHSSHENRHDSQDFDEESSHRDRERKKHRKNKKHKGVRLIPPSRPEVTRLSDNSVMVRWNVPRNNGLPILFFKVQYREVGRKSTEWMTVDEDIAAHIHSYAVTDLRNGGKYRFRIAAVYSNNDNNFSPNSAKFVLHKDQSMKKPAHGPTITHAKAMSPSAISIYWDYEDTAGVPIEGFFIYYRATDNAGDYLKITVLGANTRSHIISHLLPDMSYDVKTQCFNVAGTSEFSNIVTSKTKPSENSEMRSDNSKPQHIDELLVTEPVSSKDSEGNAILNIVLGIVSSAMITALTVFLVIYCRQRTNRRQPTRNGTQRDVPLKSSNGHIGNGYLPVLGYNINVNPLSELDEENQRKSNQNGGVVSNNNEIIQLQTFTNNEAPHLEPLLENGERETTAGEEQETVIMPGNAESPIEAPRSI